ncbi:diguanylate cyclase [Desulfosediminicola flagellatus]|uniref:sensor domain-containing diguanylate cyclase n=1 Tax=Desulfosediminicola flagellatus TaxID=2569541 RepID=UPI0010ABA09E|nr:diguanylate cyclase [Desulfosediminicola flagellatus]
MQPSSSSTSQRIIIFPLLLVTAFTFCGFWFIDLYFSRIASQRYENNLLQIARIGIKTLNFLDDNPLIPEIDSFSDTFSGDSRFRTTVIDISGTVLGDSRLSVHEVKSVENHADRSEIIRAREKGVGISRRYSSTLNIDLLYVAILFNNSKLEGYFRVAIPLDELQQELFRQRLIFISFGIAALLIVTATSILNSRYIITLVKSSRQSLEKRAESRTKEIEILQNLGTQLTACNSKDEALEVIRLVTTLLLPRFNGSLAVFRASKDRLEISADWNGDWEDETSYQPEQCWALRTGKTHLGNPDNGTMSCSHSRLENQQMLCIPLVAQGETHGVLHLAGSLDKKWSAEELQLASAVAENASLTFASLNLRESLRQQAIRDPLTGLYNRRYLHETIDHELSRAARRDQTLGLLMMDLDHFKKFNDEHGHDVGDFILSEFGRLLRMLIRDEDIACRYGGEEFTVLLPETDTKGALSMAERIIEKVRNHDFSLQNISYGPVTISVGASIYPAHGDTDEQLFKEADGALYAAKNAGRNRVMLAPIPGEQPQQDE